MWRCCTQICGGRGIHRRRTWAEVLPFTMRPLVAGDDCLPAPIIILIPCRSQYQFQDINKYGKQFINFLIFPFNQNYFHFHLFIWNICSAVVCRSLLALIPSRLAILCRIPPPTALLPLRFVFIYKDIKSENKISYQKENEISEYKRKNEKKKRSKI